VNTDYVTIDDFSSNDCMDYTASATVNLVSRLQSRSEIDILLGHETYSLVKDEVAAQEQTRSR
jgi:class 3 adenylate cyclase